MTWHISSSPLDLNACSLSVKTALKPLKDDHHHCSQKSTIHQVTTILDTSKYVLFPGRNHLSTDDPTLWTSPERQRVQGDQYQGLAGGYDSEIGHFEKWLTGGYQVDSDFVAQCIEQTCVVNYNWCLRIQEIQRSIHKTGPVIASKLHWSKINSLIMPTCMRVIHWGSHCHETNICYG